MGPRPRPRPSSRPHFAHLSLLCFVGKISGKIFGPPPTRSWIRYWCALMCALFKSVFLFCVIFSTRKRLFVMQSLGLGGKFSCQIFFSSPQILTRCQHQKLVFIPPPTPFPPRNRKFRFGLWFWKFGVKLDVHQPLSPTPSIIGLWDFSRFGLNIKSWKLVTNHPPPPPHSPTQWDFGILADLDSVSKVGSWVTPLPPVWWKFGILPDLDSAPKVGSCSWPPPPSL